MIRAWLHRRHVAWRRRRLLRAYAKEFEIRHGKSGGFTPIMYAWDRAESEGLLELEGGEIEWKWPDVSE